MRNKLERLLALVLVFALLSCLAACGGEGSSSEKSDSSSATSSTEQGSDTVTGTEGETISSKDTLVMVSQYTDTGNYNPWTQFTSQASAVNTHCLEGLLVMQTSGEYKCVLAESYEWIDNLTLQVKIRDNVYFHNGDIMTVEDVIFCNEMSKACAAQANGWRMVDTIEKIDDKTIQYNLGYADADVLNALVSGKITCKAYYEEVGELAFGTAPVGTGYYMWDSYISGDSVTFKAFDKYWGEHGTIKTFTIRFISELSQALIELENGNVDFIPADGSTMTSIEGNEAISTLRYSSLLNEYCGFNFNSTKVQDIKVRQSISQAIDRSALVAGAREGFAVESDSIILKAATTIYNEKCEDYYKYDPDAAKATLGELGYSTSNPLKLTLLTDTSPARTLEAQQLKNMLDAVGFEITISTFESATVTSILAGGAASDYDIYIRAIGTNSGAPLVAVAGILSLDATESKNNPTWLTADSHELAKRYDELIYECKQAIDSEERIEKYKELQEVEREMCMVCWLLCSESCFAMSSNMRGYYVEGSTLFLQEVYFVD